MKKIRQIFIFFLFVLIGAAIWKAFPIRADLPKVFGAIEWSFKDSQTLSIGAYDLFINPRESFFTITKNGNLLWSTPRGAAFLGASTGKLNIRENRASYRISFQDRKDCEKQVVEKVYRKMDRVILEGFLFCQREKKEWRWSFYENEKRHLSFSIDVDQTLNRVYAHFTSNEREHFFGSGEQFTHFDLKGHRIPLWVSEQGIGRGVQPVTALLNLIAGSGGDSYSTYISSPLFVSTNNRALILKNSGYGEFDFRKPNEFIFDYWETNINGVLLEAASPKALLTKTTEYTGRMRALPDWIHRGPILGLQGGSEHIRKILKDFLKENIAGLWLQDWVGQRKTSIGKQLWWSWDLDREHYPNWQELLALEKKEKLHLLGYINPFFVNPPTEKRKNYQQEGEEKGYFIKSHKNETMKVIVTDFPTSLLDLSNNQSRSWMKSIIQKELMGNGFWGWMADFGEALPVDGNYESQDPISFHNRYPVEWAKLNREAILESENAKNLTFFTRSGFLESPKYSTLFWTGDQLVSWDQYDGLKSSLTALLSSGLSGFTFNHSDIGGYTSFKLPVFSYVRSKELMIRWMELNAFTLIFRSHEGNQPENNLQVYSTPDLRAAFLKNAQIFSSLFSYRKKIIQEAANYGWPGIRPMWFEFPEEKEAAILDQQFLLGSDLLIAPVLSEGESKVNVFFPKGKWKHFSTGKILNFKKSNWREVAAPIGTPAAYWRIID